jgi:TonB family protein
MAVLSSTGAVVEIADAAPWVSKSSSPWVRGPLWDGFWILSATESLARLHRSVYRMSDPQVRAAARGLVGNASKIYKSKVIRRLLLALVFSLGSLSSLHAQSATPARSEASLKAIYTPKPVYRAEWTKQGLTGKGVVLVTIDKETGKVTGARMLTSTGNKLLDGAALEAYSQWRFQPGTVSQVKIPIEFANRPKPPTAKRTLPKSAILYPLLILLGFAVAVIAMRTRRRDTR